MTIVTLFDKILPSRVYLPMGVIMNKFKLSVLVIGCVLCLSTVSQARVCFLGGGNDFDGDGVPDDACLGGAFTAYTTCPGYTSCDIPPETADVCKEGGKTLYKPQDCCSNNVYWGVCDADLGYVCNGETCSGTDAEGVEHERCELGKCQCAPSFNKECLAKDGLVGVGIACGGKYEECQCDRNKHFKCGNNAKGVGACTDAEGTWYSQCVCPSIGSSNWVSDSEDCCVGVDDTCMSQPGNAIQYKCYDNLNSVVLGCKCGVTYQESKSQCVNGCSDSQFSFIGNNPLVTCPISDMIMGIGDNEGGFCGNNCTCIDGYFDYEQLCEKQTSDICASLGYVDNSCSGQWLACPYDPSAKICLDCDFKTLSECQNSVNNSVCTTNNAGCYTVTGCTPGYTLSSDHKSCVEKNCTGFITCGDGLYGMGNTCINSKGVFYETCGVAETCYDVSIGDVPYRKNDGACEVVVAKSNAQEYLNNGYYQVQSCQPIDAETEERVRLHACSSEEKDCAGNYSPVKGYPAGSCLNASDGRAVTCGGKTYATECKCNDENDGYSETLCKVYEVPSGMVKGDQIDRYVFTGDYKTGCAGFGKKYGYFVSRVTHTNYCKGDSLSGYVVFDGAVDACDTSYEKCPAGKVLFTSDDGKYEHCATTCAPIESACSKYNNAEYTGNKNCHVYEAGTTKVSESELGIVPETANASTKCAFFAKCGSEAYCSKFGYNSPLLPNGYNQVGTSVVPEGANTRECGTSSLWVYTNATPCPYAEDGCSLTNNSTLLNTKLSGGNYQVSVSGAPSGCYYYASCEATGRDCLGNKSPIYDRVTVESCASTGGFATNYVECGGQSYPTACASTCAYDRTEKDCTTLGKKFVLKCVKDDDTGSFKLGQCI